MGRGRPPNTERIARAMTLRAQGWTLAAIADELSMRFPQAVHNILNPEKQRERALAHYKKKSKKAIILIDNETKDVK